jgi:putative transposase
VAKKGGALPAYEELELIRLEGQVSVRRFLARLGIPRSTWYYWRFHALHGRAVRRWPAPVVDALAAWAIAGSGRCCGPNGVLVSASSVERALRRHELLQPRRYQAERPQLARARRATFIDPPARRNRVWQADFTEFETTRGGTSRILVVVDYATKVCLAGGHRDERRPRRDREPRARAQRGRPAAGSSSPRRLPRRPTGELAPLVIVTDNGPAFKSVDFVHIARHPELRHVRTRHHAPKTNGVVERFNGSLKYEHLYREEIGDVIALQDAIDDYRELYNWVRPHEALGLVPPMVRLPRRASRVGPRITLSAGESVQIS